MLDVNDCPTYRQVSDVFKPDALECTCIVGKAQPASAQGGDKYVCQLQAASGNSCHDTF